MPAGILGAVVYTIYIVIGWGNYGYKHALDYSSEGKIFLKCKNQNSAKMKYYQVTESPYNKDPLYLKYFHLKKKKIVPIAGFTKHIDNNNAYEFKSKERLYQINRKNLQLKSFDLKTQKLKFIRECNQVAEDKFIEIIENIKKDGKKF